MKLNICIPAYNASETIIPLLDSINTQTYKNFNIYFSDDNSTDNTAALVFHYMQHHDMIFHIYLHNENVGCAKNLDRLVDYAETDNLLFLANDDVLVHDNVLELYAKELQKDVAVVGRYYYWFDTNFKKPIRLKRDTLLLPLCDQVSGIAIKKRFIENKFQPDPFVEMASVVYPIIKKHNGSIIFEDTIAVRSDRNPYFSSGWAFNKSPSKLWYELIKDNPVLVNHMLAHNFVGLVHIKNYGKYWQLIREIGWLYRLDPWNVLNWKFWFFTLGTLLTPKWLLRRLVKEYKHLWANVKYKLQSAS